VTRWRHHGHAACTIRPAQALHMVWPQGNSATTLVNSKQTGHSAEAPEGSGCGASSCSSTPGHEALKIQYQPLRPAQKVANPRAASFAKKHFVTASATPCSSTNAVDMLPTCVNGVLVHCADVAPLLAAASQAGLNVLSTCAETHASISASCWCLMSLLLRERDTANDILCEEKGARIQEI